MTGIFLLVDDSLISMKMLFKQVTKILCPESLERSDKLKSIASDELWQQQGFLIELRGEQGIVCAANGRVAYEIAKILPIRATITDYEMPIMTGMDLIMAIRKLERNESRTRMRIALNTALLVSNLTSIVSSEIDVVIQKGDRTNMMSEFFEPICGVSQKRSQAALP